MRVYLWFGGIRRAKKLEVLIDAIGRRADRRELLLLAGHGVEEYVREIRSLAREVNNIRLLTVEGTIPPEDLLVYARACDLFVFCHGDDHLTSGGPHLSQAYLRPQVVVSAPYMRETLGEGGIYIEQGADEVENLMRTLDRVTPEMLEEKTRIIEIGRADYAWDRIGQATADFYAQLLTER